MLFLKSWCELTYRHDDDVTDGCSDGAVGIQTDAFTMSFDFVIKTHTVKIHNCATTTTTLRPSFVYAIPKDI